MKEFKAIKELIASLEDDYMKFYDKQNKTAGTRVRKGMQEIKVLAQVIRADIQNKKNVDDAKASKEKKTKK